MAANERWRQIFSNLPRLLRNDLRTAGRGAPEGLLTKADKAELLEVNPWWDEACGVSEAGFEPGNEALTLAGVILGASRGTFFQDGFHPGELNHLALSLIKRGLDGRTIFYCSASNQEWRLKRDIAYFRSDILPAGEVSTVVLTHADILENWYATAKYIRSIGIDRVVIVGATSSGDKAAKSILMDKIAALRTARGLSPLVENKLLSRAAEKHAPYVILKGNVSHTGRLGSLRQRIRYEGYRGKAMGENICLGEADPQTVFSLWMASESHRKNLLNKSFRDFGLAMNCQGERSRCVSVLTLGGGGYYLRTYKGIAIYLSRRAVSRLFHLFGRTAGNQ
jgi:uncharacterized protein YkwD